MRLEAPLDYARFVRLLSQASLVLTDSGGIQEETTILGVPCVTLRENTERPVTVTDGTNRLAGTTSEGITKTIAEVLAQPKGAVPPPPLWDGQAGTRIAEILERWGSER